MIILNGSAHFEREGLARQTAEDFYFKRACLRCHDDFCKTYARPYDVVVVAVLLAARSLGVITWFSSDARHRGLCAGLALAREAAPSWRIRLPRLRSRALDLGF